jgi:heme/copper-type cytochrome/quinol oxidase subunit 1
MIFRQPYLICWLAVPVLMLMGLLFRQHSVDVQLHDTYFVIANNHVALAGSALLLVLGLGYWLMMRTRKTPNDTLTAFHLLSTIGVFVLLVLPLSGSGNLVSPEWLLLGVAAFLVGQCAYAVNILITLLRR